MDSTIIIQTREEIAAAAARAQALAAMSPGERAAHWIASARKQEAMSQWSAAQDMLERLLAEQPGHFEAVHLRGVFAAQAGQWQEALGLIDQALLLDPGHAGAHNNRGNVLAELKRFEEAVQAYGHAITLEPGYAEALNHLGKALTQLGRSYEAIAPLEKAVALKPELITAWLHLGAAFAAMNLHTSAIPNFHEAIRRKQDFAEAHYQCGNSFHALQRFDVAIDCYRRALDHEPSAKVHLNYGHALRMLMRNEEAIWHFEQAMRLDPQLPDAPLSRSLVRLLTGDFKRGLPEYETRWDMPGADPLALHLDQPRWDGTQPLDGRTILLYGEQGAGDSLQFCRYATLLAERGARVIMTLPDPLRVLLGTLKGVESTAVQRDDLPPLDLHSPMLSLPLAFGTDLSSIPASGRYLHPDPARVARWRERLGPKTRPRIGIAWSGSPAHQDDATRSIPLAEFTAALPGGFDFISLQKDVAAADRDALMARADIRHFGDELHDFAETAALCELVDMVVTVDTSAAHLAGAMAKPVWILLTFRPDWRWLVDRPDSPWYPTARLVRQEAPGQWPDVLARVGKALIWWRDGREAAGV